MNKTAQDAYERVLKARLGSLAGDPSQVYLESLIRFIDQWRDEINARWNMVIAEKFYQNEEV